MWQFNVGAYLLRDASVGGKRSFLERVLPWEIYDGGSKPEKDHDVLVFGDIGWHVRGTVLAGGGLRGNHDSCTAELVSLEYSSWG